ncbi:MAG TPA: aminoacyl-tRNA hydrolase [Candidatus Eisenbacteria bacterium]|nr:aminoacyl-tRNA hydrolase [Candidatus Eisenbacteria bacterium]
MRVVVGLGNPGRRYARTRHNMGFLLLDRLAGEFRATAEEDHGTYRVAFADVDGEPVALVRPLVFMNRSGEALVRVPESALAGPEGHLVLLDDVWLPFGTMRFRKQGGAGGHHGLLSVLEHLGTEAVPRLRLGIGGGDLEELSEHVLAGFSDEEAEALDSWLVRAGEGVRTFLTEGAEAAMSRYNG